MRRLIATGVLAAIIAFYAGICFATEITRNRMNAFDDPSGWGHIQFWGTGAEIVTADAYDPEGGTMLRYRLPIGIRDGQESARVWFSDSTPRSEVYVQFYHKYASDFVYEEVGNKVLYVYSDGDRQSHICLLSNYGDMKVAVYGDDFDGEWIPVNMGLPIKGVWYKYQLHFKANSSPGAQDGILQVWVNNVLKINRTNVMYFNGNDTVTGWIDYDLSNSYGGQESANPVLSYTYFDDFILSDVSAPGGADTTPPTVSGRNPAPGDTNVATTNRDVVAILSDASGVDITKIKMSVGKNGGAKTAYTCASGLTCSGSSAAYTVTRTMTSDWTAGDVVQVLIDAADLVSPPNVMPQASYSYQVATTTGAPYPASTFLSGVNWETSTVITLAPGTDLWPMTWAGDNNVYAAGGDGGGFGGTNTQCRARTTVARITGTPPSITGTNISGCKSDGTGCDAGATHDAACNSPYATGWNGVPQSIVAIDNTLWLLNWMFGTPNGEIKLYSSTNYGQTWTGASWTWTNGVGTFIPQSFLQFGMGYASAPDNTYLYLYGRKEGSTGTYLARVVKSAITTQAAYQYYRGLSGSVPVFGGSNGAVPVFYSTDGNANDINVSYFPALGRYIATGVHGVASDDPTAGEIQKLGVFESANMYGPWYTVYYTNTWRSLGTVASYGGGVNPKWRSEDNLTFYMTYTGSGSYDSFNLIKGTLAVASPAPPTGVSVGSYIYGPYFYGSMQ